MITLSHILIQREEKRQQQMMHLTWILIRNQEPGICNGSTSTNPARGKTRETGNAPHVDSHPEPGRDDATGVDPHLDPELRMCLTGLLIRN